MIINMNSVLIINRISLIGRHSLKDLKWNLVLCRTGCCHSDFGNKKRIHNGRKAQHLCRRGFSAVGPHYQSCLYKSNYLMKLSHGEIAFRLLGKRHLYKDSLLRDISNARYATLSCTPSCSHSYLNYPAHFFVRQFQTSSAQWKEESKVEKTKKALKESAKEAEDAKLAAAEQATTELVPPKKTLWQKFVGVCKHYYHGFRLLFIDMRICAKLVWQLLNGKTLTRREYQQLVRTTADMFRLLPMLVFLLVPFAEFLLPVALKLFPNMLPSTFAEEATEKEKVKKHLKVKIEMAKFLQNTIKESSVQIKKADGQTVETFSAFLDQIRDQGIKPKTKDIMKFAKLFENEITLDNLSRKQLRACCTMLGITPIGSDALLRFLLQMKLRGLMADDKMIEKEGIDALTISELQAANRARGMRALGVPEERLKDQLQQWLQLHLVEQIPTSLLLLSRALYLPETLSTEEKIGATITQLADTAVDEAKVKVAEISGEKVDNKTKLEIIKHEEEIIAAEKEEMQKEEDRLQKERETKLLEEQEKREMAEAKAAETAMQVDITMEDPAQTIEPSAKETLIDKAEVISEELTDKEKELTRKDLDEMENVLEEIAKVRKIDIQQDALKGLKDDVSEYKEDLEDLKDIAIVCGADEMEIKQPKGVKRLSKKIDRMINRLNSVVDSLQDEKHTIQEKMTEEEKSIQEELGDTQLSRDQIDEYKENIITINEMLDALKRLKKVPDDTKMRRIFQVLDEDKDGNINFNHAIKVLELLSSEHLNLSESTLKEVNNLLKHEAELEVEEKQKEKEEKERMEAENALQKKQEQQQG